MNIPWKSIIIGSFVSTAIIAQISSGLQATLASHGTTILLLFFALLVVCFVWQVIIYPKLLSPIRHLPRPSGASFFNGHLREITLRPSEKPFQRWINETPNDGLIYYNYLFNAERIFVTSPEALDEVLVHKCYDFVKPRPIAEGLRQLLGDGILLAEGEEHKVCREQHSKNNYNNNETAQLQRKILMRAFNSQHVKGLYPVFWMKSREMVDAITQISQPKGTAPVRDLKNAAVVEISDWTSRATLDIIGLAGMGDDFNAIGDPTSELAAAYRSVLSTRDASRILSILYFFVPFWFLKTLPFRRNLTTFQAANTIRRTCRQLINKKRNVLNHKEDHADILATALTPGAFTDDHLVNQMMTFLAAGHETTATAVTWGVHLLCLNADVQTHLRKEIKGNIPSIADIDIASQKLDCLPYLHAVCNEILRIKPPLPLTVREAGKDTTILGTFIPKGTRIILAPAAVNQSASLWGANPEKFNPNRWMSLGKTETGGAKSKYSFLTFLHGPRSCIGQSFAKAEFKCLLAALVGRFEMELEDADREIETDMGFTLKPKDGLRVRMRPIEGW
ncbi:hypothetical protein MMC07_000621 [Pseudocyphellaria aurata]|nr:hypothetical protein [Pseudocyphellaria aurata]